MKKPFFLLKLIGIAILILIFRKINFSLVLSRIKNCNLFYLSAALIFQLVVMVVRSIRWRYILELLHIKVTFYSALRAFWSGLYLAAITPGKLGEIARVYFIAKNNPSITRSVFSVIIDRLADVIMLLIFGIIGTFCYLSELSQLNKILISLFVGLGLSIWFIFSKLDVFYALFRKLLLKFFNKKKITPKENLDLHFLQSLKASNLLMLFFYIFSGWIIFFFGWWLLAKSLYIHISFLKIILTVSIATIVSIVPISVSGLGTRDAAVIFLFFKMGIAKDAAIAFSLLIFVIEIAVVCIGVFFLLRRGVFLEGLKINVRAEN